MNKIILIRHAPSVCEKGIVPPRDPEADCSDTAAFAACADALPARADWWVSPLKRCRMTTEALIEAGAEAASVSHDDRLIEQDYGTFHGRAIADVWEEVKDEPRTEHHFIHHDFIPPGGESFTGLYERLRPVADDMKRHDGNNLVIVSHAMVIRSLIAHACGLSCGEAYGIAIAPLSLSRIVFGDDGMAATPETVNKTF